MPGQTGQGQMGQGHTGPGPPGQGPAQGSPARDRRVRDRWVRDRRAGDAGAPFLSGLDGRSAPPRRGRVRLAGWLHRQAAPGQRLLPAGAGRPGVAQVVIEAPTAGAWWTAWPLHPRVRAGGRGEAVAVPAGARRRRGAPAGGGGALRRQPPPPPFDLYRPALEASLPAPPRPGPGGPAPPPAGHLRPLGSLAGFRATLRAQDFVEVQTPSWWARRPRAGPTSSGWTTWGARPTWRRARSSTSRSWSASSSGSSRSARSSGRAARHAAPPQRVRLARRRAGLHPRPLPRDGTLLRDHAGDARRHPGAGRRRLQRLALALPELPARRPGDPGHRLRRGPRPDPARDGRGRAGRAGPSPRTTSAGSASGPAGARQRLPLRHRATRRPSAPSTPTPGRRTARRTRNGFDLLFRGVELVTGGQRLHRYEDYLAALAGGIARRRSRATSKPSAGMPPHGGFAIGLERWVARLSRAGQQSERPRSRGRLNP